MARVLVSLRKQQNGRSPCWAPENGNFTQRVSSKMLISGQKRLNVDFTLTRDGREVDFS